MAGFATRMKFAGHTYVSHVALLQHTPVELPKMPDAAGFKMEFEGHLKSTHEVVQQTSTLPVPEAL